MQEIASTPMCNKLIDARLDPRVKAIVIRIDSPGMNPPILVGLHKAQTHVCKPASLFCSAATVIHSFDFTNLHVLNQQVFRNPSNEAPTILIKAAACLGGISVCSMSSDR